MHVLLDVADGCLKEVVRETTECACAGKFLTDFRNVRVFGIAPGNALMAEFGPRTGAQNRHSPRPIFFLRKEYFDMPCRGSVHRGSFTCGDVTHGAWERRHRPEAEDPPAWVERPLRLSIGPGFDPDALLMPCGT